jgi:hypothetical protein
MPVLPQNGGGRAGRTRPHPFSSAITGPDGSYAMDQLSPGKIQIDFFNCSAHGNYAPTTSGTIALTTGSKPTSVCVYATPASTDSDQDGGEAVSHRGSYAIEDLPPGSYQVQYSACGGPNIGDTWFAGPGRTTADETAKAAVVAVAPGSTTRSVDATPGRYGAISGDVTGPGPAEAPLPGICVQVTPAGRSATPYLTESAGKNGDYRIGPLPPGRYLVEFEAGCAVTGYDAQWWRSAASRKDATLVEVRAGRTRPGVDASMKPAS